MTKYKNIIIKTRNSEGRLKEIIDELVEKNYFSYEDIISIEEKIENNEPYMLIKTKNSDVTKYIYIGGRLFEI